MPETVTFVYTGAQQSWEVPVGVEEIELELLGAQGGGLSGGSEGGEGGKVTGVLAVTPGSLIYINVGGRGGDITLNNSSAGIKGWNGGGKGATGGGSKANYPGAGGGGATDIRVGGTALANRKAVAAGGGGCGSRGYSAGGSGGTSTGENGYEISYGAGAGGSQSAGGAGGTLSANAGGNGTLGVGGDGDNDVNDLEGGAGGGGGYYGGGGSAPRVQNSGGGGGGSNYTGGITSAVSTRGVQTGDGQVSITYVDNVAPSIPTGLTITSDVLDTTPTFSADVSDPDLNQQIKARFQVYQSDGTTLIGTVDSAFRVGDGTVTSEYTSALAAGNYHVRVQAIDDAGAGSAYSSLVSFSIKSAVIQDTQFLWNTESLVSVDTELKWNTLANNQKDFQLLWNVSVQSETGINLLWSVYPVWVLVDPDPESPVTWSKVSS